MFWYHACRDAQSESFRRGMLRRYQTLQPQVFSRFAHRIFRCTQKYRNALESYGIKYQRSCPLSCLHSNPCLLCCCCTECSSGGWHPLLLLLFTFLCIVTIQHHKLFCPPISTITFPPQFIKQFILIFPLAHVNGFFNSLSLFKSQNFLILPCGSCFFFRYVFLINPKMCGILTNIWRHCHTFSQFNGGRISRQEGFTSFRILRRDLLISHLLYQSSFSFHYLQARL